jgi:hypothetical protein
MPMVSPSLNQSKGRPQYLGGRTSGSLCHTLSKNRSLSPWTMWWAQKGIQHSREWSRQPNIISYSCAWPLHDNYWILHAEISNNLTLRRRIATDVSQAGHFGAYAQVSILAISDGEILTESHVGSNAYRMCNEYTPCDMVT